MIAVRRPGRQREFGQGQGKELGSGQGKGSGQGSGFGLSLSSMSNDQGIRDITLYFHKDHAHDVGGGGNGNGNDRRSGTVAGSNRSAFNIQQVDRQDSSHPNDPAMNNPQPSTSDSRKALMIPHPHEYDLDQYGAMNRSVDDDDDDDDDDGGDTFLCPFLRLYFLEV